MSRLGQLHDCGVQLAFTARLPLVVLIAMGVKRWENRIHLPTPQKGTCAISCSSNSTKKEYENFLRWADEIIVPSVSRLIPQWNDVSVWRGHIVAVCDYNAGCTPGPAIWDEGYPIWWEISNVRLLDSPIACRGGLGMWDINKGVTE